MPTLSWLFLRNLSSRSLASARAMQTRKRRKASLRTKVFLYFTIHHGRACHPVSVVRMFLPEEKANAPFSSNAS